MSKAGRSVCIGCLQPIVDGSEIYVSGDLITPIHKDERLTVLTVGRYNFHSHLDCAKKGVSVERARALVSGDPMAILDVDKRGTTS